MYEAWTISRWATPVSDIRSIVMVSLKDEGQLSIVLEAPREPGRPRWEVAFARYPAYQNIPEEFRLELWQHLDKSRQRCGHTFEVANSPWIASLKEREALVEVHFPSLRHFVITTEDDVVEVLSPEPALVTALGSTPDTAPSAGKSTTLYYPQDKEKVDALIAEIKNPKGS